MPKTTDIVEPYFSHDLNSRTDEKIVKMFFEFRKNKDNFSEQTAKDLLPLAAYGIYWAVVEYMHKNNLSTVDIDMLADELRINSDILSSILNDFGLFKKDNDFYFSDRILRNITKQQQKTNKNKEAAKARWLLSAYSQAYFDEFGITPVLEDDEKTKLINYSKKIENLKDLLPDIFFTLKSIKFDNGINFNPASNWLLKGNNLGQILNGQWGKLKHKKTPQELQQEKQQQILEKNQQQIPTKLELQAKNISNKDEAIKLLKQNSKIITGNKLFILPTLQSLKNKFNITDEELKDYIKDTT